MPVQYRDMYVTEFLGWAKQNDLPARLDVVLADANAPAGKKALARVGKAFCQETQIQTFYASRVINLATQAVAAGIITAAEQADLLALITFDPAEEALKDLADHAVARQSEVDAYQTNIDNYTAMIAALNASLPADWPQNLAQYKTMSIDQVYATVPDASVQQVIDLLHRDRLKLLLRSETGEQRKAKLVLDQLAARLPAARRDALLADARSRAQLQRVSQ